MRGLEDFASRLVLSSHLRGGVSCVSNTKISRGDLVAKPSASVQSELEQRFARGESVTITVAMTGRLIPDESIIYDFSHDQDGLGVIMPVVKVERLEYVLTR